MLRPWRRVRPDERPLVVASFSTIGALMTAHMVLETARDALFLSTIPARLLPWTYVLIAGLALIAMSVQRRLGATGLQMPLFVAALSMVGFWFLLPLAGDVGLFALYGWSGVLGTMIVVQFWASMGRQVGMVDAKRLFPPIAGGATVGALVGSGAASLAACFIAAHDLLLVAAFAYLLAWLAARRLADRLAGFAPPAELEGADKSAPSGALRQAFSGSYVRQVGAIILVSTMAMTTLDFVFKDQMAARFAPGQLGLAFALIYLGLNLLSLVVQIFFTGPILQRVGVVLALSALPLVVSAGGIIGLAGWLFGGAVLGKVGDGAFRHTLARTGRELLYLPMERTLRDRAKPLIDILGHRFGQALASILLLLLLALQWPPVALLVGLCGVWLTLVLTLKRRYLRMFRDTIRQSVVDIQPDFPELDMQSLDSLVTRLGSENDDEVLASMAVLDRLGRDHLISALILYHPSAAVVEAALDHFASHQRRDFIPVARRLLGRSRPRVHAAVVLALHAVDPDEDALKSELGAGCGCTRATAAVLLMDSQPELAQVELQDWSSSGPVIRHAIARATRAGRGQASLNLLFEILKDTDRHVRKAALQSLSERMSPKAVGPLLGLLSDIEHGTEAFGLLVSLGARIAETIDAALANPDTDSAIRWRLPELLARLDPQGAPARLKLHLAGDIHSRVEARIILSLSQLHIDHPEIAVPSVAEILSRTLDEAVELAYADQVLCSQPDQSPLRCLLSTFLCDKRDSARDAVLRLSCLSWRSGDARRILRGLRNTNPIVHASALELLEANLSGPDRELILRLARSEPSKDVLDAAGRRRPATAISQVALLTRLLTVRSESLRQVVSAVLREVAA